MKDLLKQITDSNILLEVEDGKLKVFTNETDIHPALLAEIKQRKAELLQFLSENNQVVLDNILTRNIPVAPVQESYPLSSAQRRLWLASQTKAGSVTYHMPKCYTLEGAVNEKAFEFAFEQLITRHESLRTIFKENEEGDVRQWILPYEICGFKMECCDLRSEPQQADVLNKIINQQCTAVFDLTTGPLTRAALLQIADRKWIFVWVMHHIICDGWSLHIMISELLQLYHAHVEGKAPALTHLPIQYKDYAVWQQQQINEEQALHHKQYWVSQLDGELPVLMLPTDKPRPAIRSHKGGMEHVNLPTELVEKLKVLLAQEGATLFMGLLATVNGLLYRYTGQYDIITGSPVAGREHIELEGQVGLYLNALAIRTRFSSAHSFRELLNNIRQTMLEAWEHRDYPFDHVVAGLNGQREAGRNALFDVFVDLHDGVSANKPLQFGSLTVTPYNIPEHTVSKFDLTFMFLECGEDLSLSLEYNTDLFERTTARRLLLHFEGLLNAAVMYPDQSIAKLNFIGAEQKDHLLSFSNIPSEYIIAQSPVALFEEQAAKTPHSLAVAYNATTLSYKELDEMANQLAHYLIADHRVRRNDMVGIMLDRSEHMIVAILGVLKSGAAYVPIDPDYPDSRKAYIMHDTGIKVLLTQTDYLFHLANYTGDVFAIDVQLSTLGTPAHSPGVAVHDEDLCYVIYTSGSTGNPKGCSITNAGVSNYIQWANHYYFNNKPIAGFCLFTALSFDLTVTSIYCTLTLGGCLKIYDQRKEVSAILMESFSAGSATDSIKLTPSHINILKQLDISSSPVSCVIVGGEDVTSDHVNTLKKCNPFVSIFNEYGPTEATVGCIVAPLEKKAPILIGKPIAGASIYILDESGELCPIGIPGEICIGGVGLAKEYLNKPQLTGEKFVPDPFAAGKRMYKTGDLAKWLPDGNLKFIGRKDDQVKIRGYRIEPGEIEQVLRGCAGVDAAIVVAKLNKQAEKELIAYVVAGENISVSDIKDYLATLLPEWMVPAHFIRLNEFPLTAHGKVDKRKLPDPAYSDLSISLNYVPPRNGTEERLLKILEEITGKNNIGIRDNFFSLGGDSIKAITLVVNIKKQLGLTISVNTLYENPTIEQLSHWLSINNNSGSDIFDYLLAGYEEIGKIKLLIEQENQAKKKLPASYEDIYPVVPIEQGMIFSSLMNPREPVYYDQFSFIIQIDNIELFKEGLHRLVHRHSILRTRYYMSSFSRPVKAVMPEIHLPLTFEDLSTLSTEEKTTRIRNYVENDLHIRLTFDDEILWRINLFRLEGNEHYITYSFHHAMLDGWSVSVFKTELANYNGRHLSPLKHSYKDYCAITLGRQYASDIESYWKTLLQDYTRNKLPFNYKGLKIKEAYGMKKVQRIIDKDLLNRLNRVAVDHQLSFKAICLAAHVYLLKIICSEEDITTGVVTHERPSIEDGENILGCFLTTVPIRVAFDKCTDLLSLLKQVNDYLTTAKAYEVHLSDIARFIGDKTSFGNPIFDTILNYTDFHRFEEVSNDSLINILEAGENVSDITVSHEMTNTLFDVEVGKTLDKFSARIKYAPGYFHEEDVLYALELYVRIMEAFANNVHTSIAALNLSSSEELKEMLVDFNATEAMYAKEMTLDKLFEEQVKRTPDATALKQDGISLSYSDLNERANRLAHCLLTKGVQPGDNIGLHASRSFNMIVGMYGILKAGGVYVPIDPEYPRDRQEYIVCNSGVQTVVSDASFLPGDQPEKIAVIKLQEEELAAYPIENPGIAHSSSDLAYTIYTSGSTGQPKGVMIEHHSAVNLIQWVNDTFGIGGHDRLLFITSMCFDLSVYDIFGMLAAGGTVVIARNEDVQQVQKLKYLLTNEHITFWDSVPTTMNYLIDELEAEKDGFQQYDLRLVFLSGDWIPVHLPNRIGTYFPAANIISLGGATEGTVWSNYYPVGKVHSSWSSIPYGKPIRNNTFYILNNHLQPVPKGVAGELYIGGVGVARGYANDAEKTAAAFKPDPFNDRLGGMMYKTGDLGRMMPGGNMEFLGRKDNQVKIRGFRVELGEIESVLQQHDAIKGAIVHVHKDANNLNQLSAYLLAEAGLDTAEIKEYLKGRLPAYMVPGYFMILESFPLNSNGKIDRKALPRPAKDGDNILSAYVPPVTDVQLQVEKIWRSILQVNRISIHDDLFEMGANSLQVGSFVNRIQREMDISINIRNVFIEPTIEAIANEIEKIKWASGAMFETENISDTEKFSI